MSNYQSELAEFFVPEEDMLGKVNREFSYESCWLKLWIKCLVVLLKTFFKIFDLSPKYATIKHKDEKVRRRNMNDIQ